MTPSAVMDYHSCDLCFRSNYVLYVLSSCESQHPTNKHGVPCLRYEVDDKPQNGLGSRVRTYGTAMYLMHLFLRRKRRLIVPGKARLNGPLFSYIHG